ncbi:hypothetical protein PCC8801_3110 [Rippkaea orientalis PCC 8801]|uniref:Lipoprotein n=1 Tax=Rippkaea orientalis (strain PCC 8801 / RF-1) TaxID=41431 RepID=B7JXA3_RIPO1|nr:hypothetical protein [Rippkaea orientalis]ACK67091.1 hypothetical protein PCC8801_3110 [Rippkaea orientalis PCC 8801]
MKSFKAVIFSVITTISVTLPAYADQCSYITKEQALRAVSLLDLKQMVYLFCEPCGEKVPQRININSLAVATVNYQDFWQVSINGKGIDLAYTFIESSLDKKPINLAAIAGCPASDVSPVLP